MRKNKSLSERLDKILEDPIKQGTYVPPAKRMDEIIKEHTSSQGPSRLPQRPAKRPATTR